MTWNDENLIKILKEQGVVVMPTDTIYGIVGRAENPETVSHLYSIKKRTPEKPYITLIGEIKELERFSIVLSQEQKNVLKNYWPGPVSVILDCSGNSFPYLQDKKTNTISFRLPAPKELQDLLLKTGPLVAPSANPEGLPPAKNILEAKKYFGNLVDLYLDGGEIVGKSSKLIKLHKDGSVSILRE